MPEPKLVPKDCSLAVALAAQDTVKMLIIGSAGRAQQIAEWAAAVAANAEQPSGFNARCAIWITEVDTDAPTLEAIVQAPFPTVAVLMRDNTLSEVQTDDGSNIDPVTLELMYLNAGA